MFIEPYNRRCVNKHFVTRDRIGQLWKALVVMGIFAEQTTLFRLGVELSESEFHFYGDKQVLVVVVETHALVIRYLFAGDRKIKTLYT